MNYMQENYNELALAILETAISDYRMLQHYDIDSMDLGKEGVISIAELEEFFKSDLCDSLLQNINMTGEDILKYLNT